MTKRRLKQFLYTYETNILGIIQNSCVFGVPKSKTLSLIRRETSRISAFLGLSRLETNILWINSNKTYNLASKRLFSTLRKLQVKKGSPGYDEILARRRDEAYRAVRDLYIYSGQLEKDKNQVADNVERRTKHQRIFEYGGLIDASRAKQEEGSYSPFFICDAHKNPAHEHAEHEGHIFVDEDWEKFISDPSTVKKIQRYIQNHHVLTVQYVTGEPVYLVTRKNCRHNLYNIPLDEVLGSSARSILKRHNLYLPDVKPESYEHEQYRKYYERLKVLQNLHKLSPSEQLESDIARTKQLVLKWYRANRNAK